MAIFDFLSRIPGSQRNQPPTMFALYHEARHEWHGCAAPLGAALVAFSSADQARSYAFCRELRGFLPAPLNAATIVECFQEFGSQGFHSFLLDLGLDEQYVGLFPFGEPSLTRMVRVLSGALAQARRVRKRSERLARRRARGSDGRREFNLATEACRRLRFSESIDRFTRVTRIDPSLSARAHIELGEIRRWQRQLDQSRHHYLQALKEYGDAARPDASRALAGLGYCLFQQGDHDQAIAAFRDAWRRSPDHPSHGLRLARILVHTGHGPEAGEVLEQLRDDHPTDVDVLDAVAERLAHNESWASAHLVRRKIARLKPDYQENLLKLADLCGTLHRVGEGFEVFSRAMARRPGDASIVLRFHVFCIRQGVHALQNSAVAEATRCFRTLTRAHPSLPTAQLGLALALEALDSADNVQIDDDGVGPMVEPDVTREAARARSVAESLGISPAATMFDVTLEALLTDLRQTIKESETELAEQLESLLYEDDTTDEPPAGDDD
ncbi:MAG: tetratricopeptide repeat protein [Planctomycetota bacterium]